MKTLSIARLAAASILSVGLAQGGCAAPGDEGGEAVEVVADVTYLNGGVAGYVDYPQVNSIAGCEEVAPDELDLPKLEETRYGLVRIGDYAEGELLFHEARHCRCLGRATWWCRCSSWARASGRCTCPSARGATCATAR
ncbi:MAG: hypothetical protein IKG18_03950 [Atopobiaceae bacterium]|nr:hypothetical protein [Atopobiaceae bacterium]